MTIKPGYPVYYLGRQVGTTADERTKIFDNIVNLKAEIAVKEDKRRRRRLVERFFELLAALLFFYLTLKALT